MSALRHRPRIKGRAFFGAVICIAALLVIYDSMAVLLCI